MTMTYTILAPYEPTKTSEVTLEDGTLETTVVDVNHIDVTFSCSESGIEHTRQVNVVKVDGVYDEEATLTRIGEVMLGVENKIQCGAITG